MKNLLSFITVFLLATTSLFAEGIRERAVEPAPAAQGSSVWKVTKDGNIMFLAGSIHILREQYWPLPQEYNYAFSMSEVLVLEADTEQMTDPEIGMQLAMQMLLPGDLMLHDVLDAETYELLSITCSNYGLPIESLAKFKPAMIVTILTVMEIQGYGFDQQGVDDYFLGKARANNRPVVFLESVESQIDMLITMGEGYENEYVRYSLMDIENTEDSLDSLLADWKTGSSFASEESLFAMKEGWPQIYKSLITDRHDLWLPQIEKFIASEHVHFVMAGLLHMHGPDGLLKVLADLGYRVEQVVINTH